MSVAGTCSDLQRYDEALECHRQVLVMQIHLYGESSIEALDLLFRIGRTHFDQGRFDEAHHVLLAALNGKRVLLLVEEDTKVRELYNLALTLWLSGLHEDALIGFCKHWKQRRAAMSILLSGLSILNRKECSMKLGLIAPNAQGTHPLSQPVP